MISKWITDIVEKEQEKRKLQHLKESLNWAFRDLELNYNKYMDRDMLQKYVDRYEKLNQARPLFTHYEYFEGKDDLIYLMCKDLLEKSKPFAPNPYQIDTINDLMKKKSGRSKGSKNKRRKK